MMTQMAPTINLRMNISRFCGDIGIAGFDRPNATIILERERQRLAPVIGDRNRSAILPGGE